jgi:hypothetical protein
MLQLFTIESSEIIEKVMGVAIKRHDIAISFGGKSFASRTEVIVHVNCYPISRDYIDHLGWSVYRQTAILASYQVRLPAEFKHINKQRKRTQLGYS